MSLNKSKGNMYEWVTHTWNPLAGKCQHECTYCSTNKLSARYPVIESKYSGVPRIDEKQLNTNLGKGNFIFVCAQSDLFAAGVSSEIITRILNHCNAFPENKYLLQTKDPERILEFVKLINPVIYSICTTIETDNSRLAATVSKAPRMPDRTYQGMRELFLLGYTDNYATIEPIMDFDVDALVHYICHFMPKQVNIGADSGNNNLPEPSKEKILQLIAALEKEETIKVKLKKNLDRLLK